MTRPPILTFLGSSPPPPCDQVISNDRPFLMTGGQLGTAGQMYQPPLVGFNMVIQLVGIVPGMASIQVCRYSSKATECPGATVSTAALCGDGLCQSKGGNSCVGGGGRGGKKNLPKLVAYR